MSKIFNEDRITAVMPLVERFVGKRVLDPALAADISQSTIERMLSIETTLDDSALIAYAIVSAQNAIAYEQRRATRKNRMLVRSLDPDTRGDLHLGEPLLKAEEYSAMRQALAKLQSHEREALLVHHGEGIDIGRLVENNHQAAFAVKLARYRAKLRLEYLLAFRRQELTKGKCRSVLMALSLGDKRRQKELHAGNHLNECVVCSSLAPALIERRRAMAGVLPFGALAASRPAKLMKAHPWASGAAVTASVAVAVGAVAMSPNPAPTPAPVSACASQITVNGTGFNTFQDSAAAESAIVMVSGAPVSAVPANEGFWINCADKRLWVQMLDNSESTTTVQPGHLVSFRAVLRHHSIGYAQTVGVDNSEGAPELDGVGLHAEVNANAITQSP